MNPGPRFLLMGLLSFSCLVADAASQDLPPDTTAGFEGRTVTRIDIAVRPSEDAAQIRALIHQEQGKPFSMENLRSSVADLQHTGKFTQVQVSLEPQAAGVAVLFILHPAYNVGLVSFSGATKTFSYTRLLHAVNIPTRSPFVPDWEL